MELKFLGTGSAFNRKLGCSSAYRIVGGCKLQLIDCGEDVFDKILEQNLLEGKDSVSVYITHLHSDHIGSLGSLIFYCYYIKNIRVDVLTGDNKKDVEKFLELTGALNCCTVLEATFFTEPSHVKELKTCGYKIYVGTSKYIYYSGDSNVLFYDILEDDNCIEYYQDVCYNSYENNPHFYYKNLPVGYSDKIICYHIDCDELIEELDRLNFKVAKREEL